MANAYITEAFKRLNMLDEDVFDVTDDGIQELKDFEDDSEEDITVDIIDPEAEDEDELEDSYVGKVILDCCVCHSKIYKNKEEVHLSDDETIANADEECPYCYSTDGFKVIGEVAEFSKDEEEKEDEGEGEEEKGEEEVKVDDEVEVKDEEEVVEESVKKTRKGKALKESLKKRKLKESWGDVFEDLVYRAKSWIDDGDDLDEAIHHALDDGLIYTSDIVDLGLHYGAINDSEVIDAMYEDLYSDIYAEVEDYYEEAHESDDDDIEEGLFSKKSKLTPPDPDIKIPKGATYRPMDIFDKLKQDKRITNIDIDSNTAGYYVDVTALSRKNKTEMANERVRNFPINKYKSASDIVNSIENELNVAEKTLDESHGNDDIEEGLFSKKSKLTPPDPDIKTPKGATYRPMDIFDRLKQDKRITNIEIDSGTNGYYVDVTALSRKNKTEMANERTRNFPVAKYKSASDIVNAIENELNNTEKTLDESCKGRKCKSLKKEDWQADFSNRWHELFDNLKVGTTMKELSGPRRGKKFVVTKIYPEGSDTVFMIKYDGDDEEYVAHTNDIWDDYYANKLEFVNESKLKKVTESLKVKVYNIDYDIEDEDVDDPSEIEEIRKSLPSSLVLQLDNANHSSLDYEIADAISNETGWLVNDFDYDIVSPKNESASRKPRKRVKEDLNEVTVTTDDTHMEMSTDENGKVTVTTEPVNKVEDAEAVIAPLDDETKSEIENNDIEGEEETGEEETGEEEVEADIDEFDTDNFDELGESFLKKSYNNVDAFKTTGVKVKNNSIKVEGLISFKSGAKKKTHFVFEAKDMSKRGKYRLIGENLQLSRGHKSFTVIGTINNKKFVSESLNYNYRASDANGKSQRVSGTVRVGKK